ncbi:purine nucleoside permease [Pochonia chlamydosporia 170]|uniref:Purine nucleoside permease n=1 Tax=Pochonia chlamydosporia 170 TaxID=1380566 RepID=A0A179F4B3_METCM|nr:purine nucleoside permease [Pochonia chlamydosporia 170]OAQ60210.2 purine nucleoside permease [Pochonia chlamydosporia 170]
MALHYLIHQFTNGGGSATSVEAPKVFIFAMCQEEADHWLSNDATVKLSRKIPLPGLSRGFGDVHSTADGSVCLLIVGTALINAALSVNNLISSGRFDFTKTYFILSGIAGGNPRITTLGGVAFARFAVQVDTQMEWDAREIPSSWQSGYVPMGAKTPNSFPLGVHGSEVYELNDNLRQMSMELARQAILEDSKEAAATRVKYADSPNDMYQAATLAPSILEGDVLSSNTFWHGFYLSESMDNVAKVYTAGKGNYAMTAQEDTAILCALLRAALQEKVDFSRIILMRAASNFDREPTTDVPPQLPWIMDSGGLEPAVRNLYNTGVKIIDAILARWTSKFEQGIRPDNYIGDIFGSLGGKPDFVPDGIGKSGTACSANKPPA